MIMFKILLLSCDLLHANIKHVTICNLNTFFHDLYAYIVSTNINLHMYTTCL